MHLEANLGATNISGPLEEYIMVNAIQKLI